MGIARRFQAWIGAAALALAGCATPEAPRTHLGAVLADDGDVSLAPGEAGRNVDDRGSALSHSAEAAALREQGDMMGAERAAELALGLDPGLAVAHTEWALAAEALGRPEELVAAHYALGARLAPDDARAQLLDAAWHARRGDHARALEAIDRALRADPREVEAHTRKGDLLTAQGDPAAALSCYLAALAIDPHNVPALVGVADAAERVGDKGAAESALRTLIAQVPDPTLHRSRLIAFLRRTGQQARANAEQRLLDAEAPKDPRKLRKLRR
ncbi:MAG: tetratricopeptide repeat protein [Deltaproteobacteria bacterium]|nr:tetratricopeptide repeat protein [Deltaproteobacteria bacterium]